MQKRSERRGAGPPTARKPALLAAALATGVVAVSFAAIFIRLADAPPLIIAAYRMGLAGAAMLLLAGGHSRLSGPGRQTPSLSRRHLALLALSAACLALHFAFWIASLDYTSVASSVVLVTTSPFLVALFSRLFWKEPLHRGTLGGIAVAIVGATVIGAGDAGGHGRLLGDILAFLGAVAVVGYLLVGRRLRPHIPLIPYAAAVYSGAAMLLIVAALLLGQRFTGYTPSTYLMMALLALVPQLLGHSLLNWALAHVTATSVAIVVMAEPVIATGLAIPILGELPSSTSAGGGLLVLAGIYVALRAQAQAERPGPSR